MGDIEHYDCIAIGAGAAGKLVCFMLSGFHGKKCAVVERKYLEGSCPEIACLPSKSVIHASTMAHEARLTNQHGLPIPDAASLKSRLRYVRERKTEMVETIDRFQPMFKQFNVEEIRGEGRFTGPKEIRVSNGRRLTAENIIITTGSRAIVDASIPGLVEAKAMTHIEILDNETLPEHLIIIGGGYIGMEFAQAYRRFGANVTVIQRQSQILTNEDLDIVENLVGLLKAEGIVFMTNSEVESVEGTSGDKVTVQVTSGGEKTTIHGSHILVAAGRLPNTEDLDLEKAGVKKTPNGHIDVNEQRQTSVDHVYAAGDCAGGPYFTHVGFDDHRIIVGHIMGSPRPGGTSGRVVPSVLFTVPELAHVGLREKEAQAAGIEYRLVKIPAGATFLRTHTLCTHTLGPPASSGLVKALIAKDSDKILGFTALAPNAGELLPVMTLAMEQGLDYQVIRDMIISHPTLNEGLLQFFLMVPPR